MYITYKDSIYQAQEVSRPALLKLFYYKGREITDLQYFTLLNCYEIDTLSGISWIMSNLDSHHKLHILLNFLLNRPQIQFLKGMNSTTVE